MDMERVSYDPVNSFKRGLIFVCYIYIYSICYIFIEKYIPCKYVLLEMWRGNNSGHHLGRRHIILFACLHF